MAYIYQTYDRGEAQCLICVVDDPGQADLWVYKAPIRAFAQGDAHWYITRDRQQADVRAFFTNQAAARLKVYFVDQKGQAGWKKPNPLEGKLSRGGF